MRTARRQDVLEMVCYGTRPSSRVLAPFLFNMFFTAVINVASTRFKADKGIMNALAHLREKRGRGDGVEQLPASQFSRRRFRACFTLTMPGSSRNHTSS